MKIGWIVPGFQSNPQDRCIPALTDMAHKIAEQHQLKVYALQYPGREDCYRVGRVEIQAFKPGRIPKVRRIAPLSRAIRAITHDKPDLLHAFWAAEPVAVGVAVAKLANLPLMVSCMGGEVANLPEIEFGASRHWLDRFYLWLAARYALKLIAGSQWHAELVRAYFDYKVQPEVMPLGVDLTRFNPTTPRPLPENPLMLAVGSLLPVKGHARLLEAVAHLPQVRLRIVGEGPERPRLEEIIRQRGLAERVVLAGQIDPEQMPSEYAAADLLVLPSYYESQCVALLEGLACGLPAVAAPVGIAPELLANSNSGELAHDNSPAALAAAITRLLARRSEWQAIQQAARIVAAMVSVEVCSEKLLALYRDLVGNA